MADNINTNNSASDVVTTLNSNFGGGNGIEVIAATDSAAEFARKVNANFETLEDAARGGGDSVFPAHTILVNDIGDFKAGDDIGGVSIADFITYGINGQERTKLRFLHVSDTHGNPDSLLRIKQMMDNDEDIDFAIHTGDIKDNTAGYDTLFNNAMKQISPSLVVVGNHDSGTRHSNVQANATAWVKSFIGEAIIDTSKTINTSGYATKIDGYVTYGDQSGVSCYWYKDYSFTNFKVRFIGLDQYEVGEGLASGASGTHTYTQAQMDWLAARLKEMNEDDYVVLVIHEPPIVNEAAPADAIKNSFAKDGNNTLIPTADKLFLMDRDFATGTNQWVMGSAGKESLIIDAYLHKKVLNTSFSSVRDTTVYLNTEHGFDFSQATPCHFLFHICGHLHWDVQTYLAPYTLSGITYDYSDQLMLSIATANSPSSAANAGDISKSDERNLATGPYANGASVANGTAVWYSIDDITIDFSTRRTIIKRVDGKYTKNDGTLATERHRDAIYFPFERKTE